MVMVIGVLVVVSDEISNVAGRGFSAIVKKYRQTLFHEKITLEFLS